MSKNGKRVRKKSRKLSEAEPDLTEEPPKKRSRAQSQVEPSAEPDFKKPKKLMVSFDFNNLGSRMSSQFKKSKTSIASNSPVSSTEERSSLEQTPIPPKKNIKIKFKSSQFCFTYLNSNKKKSWKGLKQILQVDKNAQWNPDVPTYGAIEAPPPLKPVKKYSDVSGLVAKYTDPLTGLYYSNSDEFETVRTLSTSSVQTIKEISDLLNTGLDDATLKVCVQLLEAGVNAEALATVVLELRREVAALKAEQSSLVER